MKMVTLGVGDEERASSQEGARTFYSVIVYFLTCTGTHNVVITVKNFMHFSVMHVLQ